MVTGRGQCGKTTLAFHLVPLLSFLKCVVVVCAVFYFERRPSRAWVPSERRSSGVSFSNRWLTASSTATSPRPAILRLQRRHTLGITAATAILASPCPLCAW